MRTLIFSALIGFALCASAEARRRSRAPAAVSPLADARQLVIVSVRGWESATGELRRFERSRVGAPWHAVGPRIAAVLGRHGLAWGEGLHGAAPRPPVKKEGDAKSPAGAFRLSRAFGYASSAPGKMRLPYLQLTSTLDCVDDPASPHYNMIVDRNTITPQDWTRAEHMLRPDGLYRIGVVVDHNAAHPVANAGSCTFLMLWRGKPTGTEGGTALDATRLEEIIAWLDPAANPVLVQLPESELRRVQKSWALPAH